MLNRRESIIVLLLAFNIVYSMKGDADSATWTGCYFVVINTLLMLLFWSFRNRVIRIVAVAHYAAVIPYIVGRFFFNAFTQEGKAVYVGLFFLTNLLLLIFCYYGSHRRETNIRR